MTPAVRAAEQARIAFQVFEYEHDPAHESYGLEAAERLGVDPARVFKTLVVQTDGGKLAVALVPVARTLNLKQVADALGAKRVEMAEPHAAERATGYVVGGISPLGQRRRLPATVDESALAHETILVSAGRRGLQLELDPRDLVRLTGADVRHIVTR